MATKEEVIREAAKLSGQTQVEVEKAYDALFNALRGLLKKGEGHLVHNFLNLRPFTRPEYEGRNPKTGDAITIPARKMVKVTVSDNLVELLNQEPEKKATKKAAAGKK